MKLLGKINPAHALRVAGALVIAILAAGWLASAESEFTGIVYGCVTPAGRIRGIDDVTGKCRRNDETIAWYTKQGAENMFLGRLSTAANANSLDGLDSTAFALSAHNHDGRYITDASQFVRASDLASLTARVAALEAGGGDDDDPPTCPSDPACNVDPLDVVFLVDTTGDMEQEISNLKNSLNTFITTLSNQYADTAFAVAKFQDFPTAPFGSPTGLPPPSAPTGPDQPYQLVLPMTANVGAVGAAVNGLHLGHGGDIPESGHEALYQLATGEGILEGGANVPPSNVGFRAGSKRVVIVITSAVFHAETDYPFSAHSAAEALQALNAINAKVVGVASTPAARAVLQSYAVQTGAAVPPSAFGQSTMCATGLNGALLAALDGMCPLVFDITSAGAGLGSAIVTGVLAVP